MAPERVTQCEAQICVGPVSGVAHCQLEAGHGGRWHRSDEAGWEWCKGQLWPLPPRAA